MPSSFRVELPPNRCEVRVGTGLLEDCGELARRSGVDAGRCAVITDANVAPYYLESTISSLRAAGFDPVGVEIKAGELSKSLSTLGEIFDRLVEHELDRRSSIFALGGGVVGDIAGLTASTFMRGVALVQVPTTLVGQVDSALGGKNGVNHRDAKNLIGTFYQPRLVIADIGTLTTLPEREFREGLAEVIKYGAILDVRMVEDLEREMPAIVARDPQALDAIVSRSLRHKADVIERDEREHGRRALLNFGHTIGHALESSSGYGKLLHGEAVSIGIGAAARLSRRLAGFPADQERRLLKLLRAAGLPVELPDNWQRQSFIRALRLDKKRSEGAINFILLSEIGRAVIRRLTLDQILDGLQ
ncbi:MAG TPA: 3-dehydroquinate synthase [Candidatus Binataceae bacterium]